MSIKNQEALKKRAQSLYRAPDEIAKTIYDAMPVLCQNFIGTLYTFDTIDSYHLKIPTVDLTEEQRFEILHCLDMPNGIKMVMVQSLSNHLFLDLHFFNRNYFGQIKTRFSADASSAPDIFPISGGHRVKGGTGTDDVKVLDIQDQGPGTSVFRLEIAPIGDYSTYKLGLDTATYTKTDPLFSSIPFKFRPGCFNTNCAPEWDAAVKPGAEPVIDYLAKDYDSFKHTLISAMMERVPNWQATSEADFDQVLIDLFSAAADELSDYQDRTMNEAYLATCRKRVSLARHARLMDYHIHQGNQADTWLAMQLKTHEALNLPHYFAIQPDSMIEGADAIIFSKRDQGCFLFSVNQAFAAQLDLTNFTLALWDEFDKNEEDLSPVAQVTALIGITGREWMITDTGKNRKYVARLEDEKVNIYGAQLHYLLNRMGLYTWEGSVPALKAGSTGADLKIGNGDQTSTEVVERLIQDGWVTHLLIEEELNPLTGSEAGRDPTRRQLLQLLPGKSGAEVKTDPVAPGPNNYLLHVKWREEDKLKRNYCFTIGCTDQTVEKVSFFNGNLVQVYHGRPRAVTFKGPRQTLGKEQYAYLRTEKWGTICPLPYGSLAYKNTAPGGQVPPQSTLETTVTLNGVSKKWDEVISLVHSDNTGEKGDHFIVETDEDGYSFIRFGNGVNGMKLPEGAVVTCRYQEGKGLDGNIGADILSRVADSVADIGSAAGTDCSDYIKTLAAKIDVLWNPFDVTNGRAPEPVAQIIRRVPEAYRYRQLRAVTLQDYVDRAQELEDVAKAAASYAWTGSWRTVRITVDPRGTTTLTPKLRNQVAQHLEAVRLIGEDLEIRPPRFVPIVIDVSLCIDPQYWPEDIRFILEQEFSEGYLPDGRTAFFHPDSWTFGQHLRVSEIIGRIQAVQGVDHVITVTMNRWNEAGSQSLDMVEVRANEIIQVKNDPDHMEKGAISFQLQGGRR